MARKNLLKATGLALIVTAAAGFSAAVMAQYTGPSNIPVMTVKQLLADGRDDQQVVLRGFVVSSEGNDRYTFADDTGKISVEIDPRRMPQGQAFNEKQRVELVGEYDKDFRYTEVDAKEVRLIP